MSSRICTVRAPNASAMTLTGTNTYLINGGGSLLCIDPGPAIARHIDAIEQAASSLGGRIETIALTHSHPDHAPAAPELARRTGARVAAHWKSEFAHDVDLRDRDVLRAGKATLVAIETPGHTFDHLAYYEPDEQALFTGDTVLGEGYVVIAPPNGAMRPYQRSLQRLLDDFPQARAIFGGHGERVDDPKAKLRDYLEHRRVRQEQLAGSLRRGAKSIPDLVREIYAGTDRVLWPAAARQLLAYLLALEEEGAVRSEPAGRAMTPEEQAILNPEWETIVGAEHAQTVRAELGALLRLDTLRVYRAT
ncbi:MAG TPA: MBL fold metallo-hydrolase [Candidatus Baltobacteraceae bacterium]|nr:MBL fold metallo-hydrolase [Candidatus Baltobacteraceae bacterium]